MLPMLVVVALVLSAADHWTTYLCLIEETPGLQVMEGNPLAAWSDPIVLVGLGGVASLLLAALVAVMKRG